MNRKPIYKKRKRKLRPGIVLTGAILASALIFAIGFSIYKAAVPDVEEKPPVSTGEEVTPPSPDEPSIPNFPDEPDETRLSFVAVGDNIIHQAIIDDAERLAHERGKGERYYFDSMYENFYDVLHSADISFVNQETMVAGDSFQIMGYPNFNTPREIISTLERYGIDVVNLATNHALDLRGKGLLNCIEEFENSSITSIGAYKNKADEENIRIIEKDGIKIAFLAYTYGTNGYTAGEGYSDLRVPIINADKMTRDVEKAKELADLVFVSMHWGEENWFEVSSAQKNAAQVLVDAGVDVIVGTHPHVLQEIKWKERPDGGKTLIAYSLGNFISTMHPPKNMFGGLLSFDIVKNNEGLSIENVLLTPTMTHYSLTRDSLKVYYLEDYSEELYRQHGTTLQEAGWSYERIINKVKETISSEFLPDWMKS